MKQSLSAVSLNKEAEMKWPPSMFVHL